MAGNGQTDRHADRQTEIWLARDTQTDTQTDRLLDSSLVIRALKTKITATVPPSPYHREGRLTVLLLL